MSCHGEGEVESCHVMSWRGRGRVMSSHGEGEVEDAREATLHRVKSCQVMPNHVKSRQVASSRVKSHLSE
jgi:hypothetical protein